MPAKVFSKPPDNGQRLVRLSKRLAVQRCARLLQRVTHMSPAEVVHRGGRVLLRRRSGGWPAPEGLRPIDLDRACEELAQRFFFGIADRDLAVASLHEHAPKLVGQVREEAARLRHVGADVFGRAIALHDPALDWRADPGSGWRWPDRPLDEAAAVAATRAGAPVEGRVGIDVKYVWELNRHQFLATLGCASWLDADAGHAAFAASLVDGWIAQNAAGDGVNWASPLEIGLRAIAWLWTMGFVLAAPALGREHKERWIRCLAQHYQVLTRCLSVYTDRTNHLIGEATALWMLATVVPSLPDAARQRARALEVLRVEIERQVTADGVSREQSIGYHCFVLDFGVQVVALARRLAEPLPSVIESRLEAMFEFLACVLGSGGDLPQIGDGDDGRAIPFPGRISARERAESLLATGAQLFGRPGWYPRAGDCAALPFWLLGGGAHAVPPRPEPRASRSTVLPEGGYCFFEATTEEGHARQLIFDVGGLGYLPNAAHEHADALSILIRVNQTLVLADPGTGTYTGSAPVRNGFRSTAAHNTVTIDDLDQADVLDTFKWVNPVRTELVGWSTSPHFDYAAAAHDGYLRLRRPVRHCREVLFVRPDYWIVVDRVEGRGRHRVTRRFHFPPDVEITMRDAATFDAVSRRTFDGLRFMFPAGRPERPTALRIDEALWSESYGHWERAACLVAETAGEPPFTLPTFIVPLDPDGPSLDVRVSAAGGSGLPEFEGAAVLCHATATRGAVRYQDILAVPPARQGQRQPAGEGVLFVRRDQGGRIALRFGEAIAVQRAGNC